ncbi:expressed protein, partial [Phakopsora pachyrhizi]
MIFTQLSAIMCFLSAVKSMNQGFKDILFGVGENVEKEIAGLVPHPRDSALSTSKAHGKSSVFDRNATPERFTAFVAKDTFSDPSLFPNQISHEFPTYESTGEHHGELIPKNIGVNSYSRFFGELDTSTFENYGNLFYGFPNSVAMNNLLEADNQRVLHDMPRSQNFKRQRLNDVLPDSNHILQVSNPLNQINGDPFFGSIEQHEGFAPFLDANNYPQLNSEFHDMNHLESLSQSLPIYDAPNAYARHSTGHKPISPSSHSKYNDANLNDIAQSGFLYPNLHSTTHYFDDIFDHPTSIPNHHIDYYQFGNLPVAHNEFLKSMPNNIPENNYNTLTPNHFLDYENNMMMDSLENQVSNHSDNLLQNKVQNSIFAENYMIGSRIIDNLNKESVILPKTSENNQLSLLNDEKNEKGFGNISNSSFIGSCTAPQPSSIPKLQRYVEKTRDKFNQKQIPGNPLQQIINTGETSRKIMTTSEKEGVMMIETSNPLASTPIGGLIDYKLNLYYIHCLSDFNMSNLVLSKEDFKDLISKPSLSYILLKNILEHDKINQIHILDPNYYAAKISSHPIDKIRYTHFEDNKFKFHSQNDLNEFITFFKKDPRLAKLHENPTSIDNYIDSIIKQLNCDHSNKKLISDITNIYKKIQTSSAEEEVCKHFGFFSNLISTPLIVKSMIPILPMGGNDNKARRFMNEMSTQSGLKRIKCLGLGDKIISKIL